MIRRKITEALALIAINGFCAAHAGGEDIATVNSAQVNLGLNIYRQFCQRCHGTELRNSGASTFDLRQFPTDEQPRFIESVSEGSGDMPPHGDVLTGAEINALFAYVVDTQANLDTRLP